MDRVRMSLEIQGGAPTIAGTRIPIDVLRGLAEAGYTVERILDEYPTLSGADVEAALA